VTRVTRAFARGSDAWPDGASAGRARDRPRDAPERSLDLRVVVTDPDGDALVLEASGLPTGALFTDQGGGVGRLLWMPSYEQAGNYPVAFKVTDAGAPSHAKPSASPSGSVAPRPICQGSPSA